MPLTSKKKVARHRTRVNADPCCKGKLSGWKTGKGSAHTRSIKWPVESQRWSSAGISHAFAEGQTSAIVMGHLQSISGTHQPPLQHRIAWKIVWKVSKGSLLWWDMRANPLWGKSFGWLGMKNVFTWPHPPDIVFYYQSDVLNIISETEPVNSRHSRLIEDAWKQFQEHSLKG